jgi:hypothetical protein
MWGLPGHYKQQHQDNFRETQDTISAFSEAFFPLSTKLQDAPRKGVITYLYVSEVWLLPLFLLGLFSL